MGLGFVSFAVMPQANVVSVLTCTCTDAAHLKHDYYTLKNHPEILINETISLVSINYSSVKLRRAGEPNNLYLRLARGGH